MHVLDDVQAVIHSSTDEAVSGASTMTFEFGVGSLHLYPGVHVAICKNALEQ